MKTRFYRFAWNCCKRCKNGIDQLQQLFSDNRLDPWRCAECGSTEIAYHAWLDGNTDRFLSGPDDRDDLWCDDCVESTSQVRESELMRDTVEPWWKQQTTDKQREAVTGLYADDYDDFQVVCHVWWNRQSNDEKIRLWHQASQAEETIYD